MVVVSQPGARCTLHTWCAGAACGLAARQLPAVYFTSRYQQMTVAGCQGRVLGTTNRWGTRCTHTSTPACGLHPNTELRRRGTQPLPSTAGWALALASLHPVGAEGLAVHLGGGTAP